MKIETLPTQLVPQLDMTRLMTRLSKGPLLVPDNDLILSNRSTLYKHGLACGGKIKVLKKTLITGKESKEVYEISFHE